MSVIGPVLDLVWQIVAGTVVAYAVPWLSDFLQREIPPLWRRYWPVIYQSILVPAYQYTAITVTYLRHSLFSQNDDSPAKSVSESSPGETMPLDQPSDPDLLTITKESTGLKSEPEDISTTAASESQVPLDGGGTTERSILGSASDPILNTTSSLPLNHEDITEKALSESATLLEGGTPHIDQDTLGWASEPISDSTGNQSSDLEDVTERAAPQSDTPSGRGTPPHDQNILGQASDPGLKPTTSIPSENEDITWISSSESPTRSEAGPPASADVDFFREYDEGRRYRIEEVIGKGSHGVVCSAYDTQLREKVAIKKISDVFRYVSDATHSLREIKLLRLLCHDDIVKIKHILLPPSRGDFKDIYIVLELTV